MKWLRGGWQRADRPNPDGATVRAWAANGRGTTPYGTGDAAGPDAPGTRVYGGGEHPSATGGTLLGSQTLDVDVSASGFRNLLIGGGVSGLGTVLCAATLTNSGSTVGMWFWQLVFGVAFFWFVSASRGMLSGRGFLFDRSGFYARTSGEVYGVVWEEIAGVGVGTLPWIQHKRPVHPERRQALEFYPADSAFPSRHPELARWLVEEPPTVPGMPGIRYRFHLPPFSRLPRSLEQAVQSAAPRKWIGQYRRELPAPQQ